VRQGIGAASRQKTEVSYLEQQFPRPFFIIDGHKVVDERQDYCKVRHSSMPT
jgi:hypothetical protein